MLGIPVQKILLGLLLSYVAYEVYNLYTFCQPKVFSEDHPDAVRWDLANEDQLDILVYLSTSSTLPVDGKALEDSSSHILAGRFDSVSPASYSGLPDIRLENLQLPSNFFKNRTVHLHALATKRGTPTAQSRTQRLRAQVTTLSRFIVHSDKKTPVRYLWSESASQLQAVPHSIASIPKIIEVGFVTETRSVGKQDVVSKGMAKYVKGKDFKLPLFVNTLISPRDEYFPLERSGQLPGFEIRFRNIGFSYWTLQYQLSMSFDEAEQVYGINSYDVDSFKQMIGGSSPWKLIFVYSVTILHLIFEYLAFSNDIHFWRTKTSFEGLSSTSLAMQLGQNCISFLYVIEVGQSKLVVYFIVFRILLQLWKLGKMTMIRRRVGWPFVEWVNRPGAMGELEELADAYEAEKRCMRYLMLALLPVLASFCAYRLFNTPFRSWYSWIILSFAVCSQTAGFVVMTPQVFMNYRLKSVDHLPWRVLSYQAVNTFIDDVFMLCIRMPEVQRYSVFRDDIVFIICCIQRFLYKGRRTVAPPEGDVAVTEEPSSKKDE